MCAFPTAYLLKVTPFKQPVSQIMDFPATLRSESIYFRIFYLLVAVHLGVISATIQPQSPHRIPPNGRAELRKAQPVATKLTHLPLHLGSRGKAPRPEAGQSSSSFPQLTLIVGAHRAPGSAFPSRPCRPGRGFVTKAPAVPGAQAAARRRGAGPRAAWVGWPGARRGQARPGEEALGRRRCPPARPSARPLARPAPRARARGAPQPRGEAAAT